MTSSSSSPTPRRLQAASTGGYESAPPLPSDGGPPAAPDGDLPARELRFGGLQAPAPADPYGAGAAAAGGSQAIVALGTKGPAPAKPAAVSLLGAAFGAPMAMPLGGAAGGARTPAVTPAATAAAPRPAPAAAPFDPFAAAPAPAQSAAAAAAPASADPFADLLG